MDKFTMWDLRNCRMLLEPKPLTEAELKRFRQQLGKAKPGDFVETDFMVGILPGPEDFAHLDRVALERAMGLGATTLEELGEK